MPTFFGNLRSSSVVISYAVLLSLEAVAIEILTTHLGFAPFGLAAISTLVSGVLLTTVCLMREGRSMIGLLGSWKLLLPAAFFAAAGLFTMFDSVSNVGASKVGLLSVPLETTLIVFLAMIFLRERLSKVQVLGAGMTIVGFILTLLSGPTMNQNTTINWGDAEAAISAVFLAISIILIAKMTRTHSASAVTGGVLLISGIILTGYVWISEPPKLTSIDWVFIIIFSGLPLLVALTYVSGVAKIGASVTAVVGSSSIMLTMLFQFLLFASGLQVIFPDSIAGAIVGGIMAISGIFLIHTKIERIYFLRH